MPEMEYWEFLLQKEGDRSWLPLESPDVEILEGRYRVVSRSSRENSNVEVRITHQAMIEVPPKRRTQQRSNRTNAEGLVVVIPYTTLKPGTWELTCSGDLMSELMGNSWQYSVQLHVVAIEAEEEWEPDWQMPSEPVESTIAATDPTPSSTSDLSEAPADAASPGLSVDRLVQITAQLAQENQRPAQLPTLQIILTQETYIARRGQPLTLSGQITPVVEEQSALMFAHAEVKICFRDPQSAQILLETRESILNQPIPTPITCRLTLPSEFKTRLILGDITLYDLTSDPAIELAHQSFTLTADADELLETIAEHPMGNEEALQSLESATNPAPPPESPRLDLTFLNSVSASKETSSFKYASDQPLPPQLYQPAPSEEGKKGLDLPTFAAPVSEAAGAKTDGVSGDITPKADQAETVDEIAAPTQLQLPDAPELEALPESQLPATSEGSSVQSAFQALNLQGRFLDRLNSLASDAALSEELRAAIIQLEGAILSEETASEEAIAAADFSGMSALPPSLEEDLLNQEVLVDDEPVGDISTPQKPSQRAAPQIPNPLLLPTDEDVPTPSLDLTDAELIAGQAIVVRAKLPNLLPRFYVKFWINDRQTRTLLDGPRWLVDFTPNGLGDLEASTQLTVPLGSLEIQLEAIAVEVATQRESHKVVLDRAVIPPNSSNLSLDEFDARD